MVSNPQSSPDERSSRPNASAWQVAGPVLLDQAIRQSIRHCWIMMPLEKKNVAAVSAEIRRVVERALVDLEQDASDFGGAG